MSLSVTMPTSLFAPLSSTTGKEPQSASRIIFAASVTDVSGWQHTGEAVIMLFTFMPLRTPLAQPSLRIG
jgi:hypothetical protein